MVVVVDYALSLTEHMPIPASLSSFLEGPLSDRYGGNAAIRQATIACLSADTPIEIDETPTVDRARASFVLKSPEPLFSYQQEIVDQLNTWLSRTSTQPAALVSLPTGGGKTRVGIWVFRTNCEKGRLARLLWVAPSAELVDQAVETLRDFWTQFPCTKDMEVSVNGFPSNSPSSRAISSFVTAQLAAKRLSDIRKFRPDLLVFDEAHQAVARTFREIVTCQLSRDHGRVLGLSATPGRAFDDEGDDLRDLFGNNLVVSSELGTRPVNALQELGVLAELQVSFIELPRQWEQIRVSNLRRPTMSIDELALHHSRFWATIEKICGLGRNAKTLVFCASLAHCYALNGVLLERNVNAVTLSHYTPAQKRASVLTRFAAGEIDVILNKTLLATGYDCPTITDVVLASPIRSPILWEQILGRASRGPAVGGTTIGHIWELDDHRKMHGHVLSYARFLGDLWS